MTARRRVILLVAWVAIGWGTALFAAPRLRGWLEEYRSRTVGPSYGQAHDAAAVMSAQFFTQARVAELLGVPVGALDSEYPKKICMLTFTDHEKTFVDAQRPERARPETGWLALTVAGRSVLGRYTANLWTGDCANPAFQYYEQPCTKVTRVDLVERREIGTAHGATEPSPLLAGQCVWRKVASKPGVVGRYRVWLPAERTITVRGFTLPATVFPSYRLTSAGHEVPNVEGERTVFRSMGEGEYELEISVQSSSDAGVIEGQYTLQIHWGHGVGEDCPVPDFDNRECYGVALPEETP